MSRGNMLCFSRPELCDRGHVGVEVSRVDADEHGPAHQRRPAAGIAGGAGVGGQDDEHHATTCLVEGRPAVVDKGLVQAAPGPTDIIGHQELLWAEGLADHRVEGLELRDGGAPCLVFDLQPHGDR